MRIEERHPDVLQNIEFAIVTTYKAHREMPDYDVIRSLEALMAKYSAEKTGQPPKQHKLSDRERTLVENMERTCEWRLGRGTLGDEPAGQEVKQPNPISLDDLLLCLKRLLKSVNRWNSVGGRQGYLDFIVQYVK